MKYIYSIDFRTNDNEN